MPSSIAARPTTTSRRAIAGDLPDGRIDLAFIDGMHLVEYALRDFMNVEAHSRPGTMDVPAGILDRQGAVAPEELLAAPFWADLRAAHSALPASVRQWRPEHTLTPEEIEASKDSPWRDKTMDPPPSRLVRMRRRILQRG